jgi:hypothetical protein
VEHAVRVQPGRQHGSENDSHSITIGNRDRIICQDTDVKQTVKNAYVHVDVDVDVNVVLPT